MLHLVFTMLLLISHLQSLFAKEFIRKLFVIMSLVVEMMFSEYF